MPASDQKEYDDLGMTPEEQAELDEFDRWYTAQQVAESQQPSQPADVQAALQTDDLTHEQAVAAAERLHEMTPEELQRLKGKS